MEFRARNIHQSAGQKKKFFFFFLFFFKRCTGAYFLLPPEYAAGPKTAPLQIEEQEEHGKEEEEEEDAANLDARKDPGPSGMSSSSSSSYTEFLGLRRTDLPSFTGFFLFFFSAEASSCADWVRRRRLRSKTVAGSKRVSNCKNNLGASRFGSPCRVAQGFNSSNLPSYFETFSEFLSESKKKQTKQNKEERKKGKRHIFYIATLFRVDRRSAVRQKDYRVFLFFLPSFSYLFLFTSFRNNRVCVLERRADRMERKKKKKKTKNRHQIKEHIVAKNQVGNVHPD